MTDNDVKSRFIYRAYGRLLRTDVELPGFEEADSGHIDIEIHWPDTPGHYGELDPETAEYSSHYHPESGGSKPFAVFRQDGRVIVRWEQLCDFEVTDDGSKIRCHPWLGISWGEVNPFIQGRVLPLALSYQGAVTLHGAAVAVNGEAVALLGTSGTGKSTLSASLHALGHPLMADDLVAVWLRSGAPVVEWGAGHVRLDETSTDLVAKRMGDSLRIDPDYDKTRVTLRTEQATDGIPLRTIYLLNRVDADLLERPETAEIPAIESLPAMMQGLSNSTILDRERKAEQFRMVTEMVGRAPVKQLRYPSDLDRIGEVCDLIIADR